MLTTPKVKFKVDLYLHREIDQIVDIHAFLINGRIFNKFYVLVSSGDGQLMSSKRHGPYPQRAYSSMGQGRQHSHSYFSAKK